MTFPALARPHAPGSPGHHKRLISILSLLVHEAFAHEDPASEWIQIIDEETGEMAAAANWRLERGSNVAQSEADDKQRAENEAPQSLSLFAAGAKEWTKVRDEFFPNQAHLSMLNSSHWLSSSSKLRLLFIADGNCVQNSSSWLYTPSFSDVARK